MGNKLKLITAAASLMLGMSSSAQAITACPPGQLCLTDKFGVSFQLSIVQSGGSLAISDYGTLYGFMEIPSTLTGLDHPVICPVTGDFVRVDDYSPRLLQFGLNSACFCGESTAPLTRDFAANPVKRVFQMSIDENGKPIDEPDSWYPMTSHIYRCNNIYEVWSGWESDYIGPYDSTTIPYDSISPDWDYVPSTGNQHN